MQITPQPVNLYFGLRPQDFDKFHAFNARDTKEILHTEVITDKSTKRAVALMSKWITSTP